ncbi:MAG: hypothetical protein U9R08_04235 [Nanoarchaeota archaeon]|nr:hypothetical protein [Nanoarchaeota archaeon]
MNRTKKLGLCILFLLFTLTFVSLTSATLSCEVKPLCTENEISIFQMQELTDSHASLPNVGTYAYQVCCSGDYLDSINPSNPFEILKLYEEENSHVNIPLTINPFKTAYEHSVTIPATSRIVCAIQTDCLNYDTCIFSFSRNYNAHVGDCNNDIYTQKICCSELIPKCNDGILNQGEEEMDSGGPCPIKIIRGYSYITKPNFLATNIEFLETFEGRTNIIKILDNTNPQHGFQSDPITIEQPGLYTATAEIKCIEGTAELSLNVNDIKVVPVQTTTDDWETLKTSYIIETGQIANVEIATIEDETAECYIDNVKFFKGEVEFPLPEQEAEQADLKGCCPESFCWTGLRCVDSVPYINYNTRITNPDSFSLGTIDWLEIPAYDVPGADAWVCKDITGKGTWAEGYIKFSYDYEGAPSNDISKYYGICNNNSHCYAKELEHCIDHQEFYQDHYCDDGAWTSRTKFLASKMLELVPENTNYDLFCDDIDFSLNRYNYIADEANDINAYSIIKGSSSPKISNNYCVLEINEDEGNVYVGTSLNTPLENTQFLNLLDIENCDNAIENNDGGYHYCSALKQNTWFNNKTQSIIYSKDDESFEFRQDMTGTEKFVNIILHPIQTLSNLLNPEKLEKPSFSYEITNANISFANLSKDFKNIYAAKQGSLEVIGIREKIDNNRAFYYVAYNGTKANLCEKAHQVFLNDPDETLGCDMTTENGINIYHIVSEYDPDLDRTSQRLNVWRGLSSKIRLKE